MGISRFLLAGLAVSCSAMCVANANPRPMPAAFQRLLPSPSTPAHRACRDAIHQAEKAAAIPANLLAAIGRVESGRRDPATSSFGPWPWTVNAEGQGYFFDTKEQAVTAVRGMQARGVRSIDVGCMQVNLMHHPDAFPSLEQAFDPRANASYAAQFLTQLYAQTKAWPQATGQYHSATPSLGEEYRRKVMEAWPEETRIAQSDTAAPPATAAAASPAPSPLAQAWSATLPNGPTPGFRAATARVIPASTPAGAQPTGHGLDYYRDTPVIGVRSAIRFARRP